MKKALIVALKYGIPLLIITYLVTSVDRRHLAELRARQVDWAKIGGAFLVMLTAVSLTFYRWYLLVRALGIPFHTRDAFRLGFVGYLFSFVSVGVVGGDLFKAIFIAREQPGRRTLAIASVMVDRVVGLYALLLVTSAALVFTPLPPKAGPEVFVLRNVTYVATILGGIGLLLLISPTFTSGKLAQWATTWPKIGGTIGRLMFAMRSYRRQPLLLTVITVQSLAVHWLMAVSVHLLAEGLYSQTPTIGEHLIIVPLSNLAGALPFTPAGLGTMELAMESLYRIIPANGAAPGVGTIIALANRLVTIGIAALGVVIYWFSRREVRAAMRAEA